MSVYLFKKRFSARSNVLGRYAVSTKEATTIPNLSIIAIVVTVGNNIPALCICVDDGGNYGCAKTIMYCNNLLTFGTVYFIG